ncbi:MAG: nucleotidyltransferase domain-containing protein [Bacteroidetes bacterium]|nr:nucleotidyltransferase domain-containing protein [Bacteroidota bacterium]
MDKKVIEIASRYALEVKNLLPVKMVILYGSYARGTPTRSSDIDIAVVVDKFQGDYLKTSADLFNLVRSLNKNIEPVLLSRRNDKSGFLESILRYGKIVYKSEN